MKWYVIQCKVNQQQRAETNLRNQNFHIYSPCIRVERIVRRKRVLYEEAVFPGYIFIKLDVESSNWCALNSTRGAGKVLSFNGFPSSIPDELINALNQRFDKKDNSITLFKTGDKVEVLDGCFKNIEAIVKSVTPDERVIVLLQILHSTQVVTFPMTQLAKTG